MDWSTIAGFGVAGNVAGHLEQAGEASDFVLVTVKDQKAPKGVFPFYIPLPHGQHPLHTMPICSKELHILDDGEKYQIEPEISILFDVQYKDNHIRKLLPRYAMAHNDCSIRKKGANKISEKKNWGPHSKGVSEQRIAIDHFHAHGILDHYQLSSYLIRGDTLHPYGVSSPVLGYQYFHNTLLDWLCDRLSHQQDEGPLENLMNCLKMASYPSQILVSIGATKYTEFGERTFLQPDDIAIVVLYDRRSYAEDEVQNIVQSESHQQLPNISVLKQRVRFPSSSLHT